jgi:hypothetical protein
MGQSGKNDLGHRRTVAEMRQLANTGVSPQRNPQHQQYRNPG